MPSPQERRGLRKSPELLPFSEKFSEKAAMLMQSAKEIALEGNHPYVGTRHLLLSMLQEPTSAKVLSELGFHPDEIRKAIVFRAVDNQPQVTEESIGFTRIYVNVISMAHDEAVKANRKEVEPADLLIALFRENEGDASTILNGMHTSRLFKNIRDTYESV